MRNYLISFFILFSLFCKAQEGEEIIAKIQTVLSDVTGTDNDSRKITIFGNAILTDLSSVHLWNSKNASHTEWNNITRNTVNGNNTFVVYTKDKINELFKSQFDTQKIYINQETDSIKKNLKLLIDALPKQTFVKMVQEQIQEATLDKIRKEDLLMQNALIAVLKQEIDLLKEEIEKLKKKNK